MTVRRQLITLCAAMAVAPALGACSGGGGSTPAPGPTARSATSALVATRWWSNSAAEAGSTIDTKDPRGIAGRLHASKTDYCEMLRQTVAAGKSVLPGATANDPALRTATEAFIAEIEAVAPADVSAPWKVLGSAVVALVASGGDATRVNGVDATAVQKAGNSVATHARTDCGVDLATS